METGIEILIVEDSLTQAEQLQHILERHGHRVTIANDGAEALALLEETRPTIIISDIMMPEMDGYELCRHIKAEARFMNIPVILLTSLSDPVDIVRGLECGADNFLTKPYDEQMLLSRIQYILLNREVRKGGRTQLGVELVFGGQRFMVTPERQQILDLLITTYEMAVQKNLELIEAQEELRALNENLEERVEERTAELRAEVVERKRAEEALHEASRRAVVEYERLLERVAALAQTLGKADDLKAIFRALRDFALASTPSNGLFISLYDPERNERTAAYAWADGDELDLLALPPMAMSDSPHSRAVATNQVIISDDYQTAIAGQPKIDVGNLGPDRVPRSSLAVPMAVMGRVVGAVEVQSTEPAAFKREHATAMRMAANLTANAIENVRLIERERESAEQLRQSQKLEAVGQLAGGVAHDFNNLLTVIGGYSELMLRRLGEDDPLRHNTEEIRRATERAASLTRQLLAFSRKQVLQPLVLDLNAIVANMDRLLRRLIGEDVDLKTVLESKLGRIKADPGQLEQVVMNLAVNARDAMPTGGKLTIETKNVYLDLPYARRHMEVQPGRYVMLAVSDSGHGMDAETQKQIFEPFFTTKEQGKGTGLGLSTVYGIVKQSGGNIWVYSEPEGGTTFKIYLPVVDEETESIQPSAVAVETSKGTETILLVEDEEQVRNLVLDILEAEGYTVLVARNGHEALDVCERHEGSIHLLMTDVVMPGMSGRQLVDRLIEKCGDVEVLYMSGYTDNAIVHHGVLDSGVAFLQKPFTPAAVARKVREVLDARRSSSE